MNGEIDPPVDFPSIAASVKETPDTADGLSQGNIRRDKVQCLGEGHPFQPDKDHCTEGAEDKPPLPGQSAVMDFPYLGGMIEKKRPIQKNKKNAGAYKTADHNPEDHIKNDFRINPEPVPFSLHKKDAYQHGDSEHNAVCINGQRAYLANDGIHFNKIIIAPTVIALSAMLKTGHIRRSMKSTT